VDIFIASDKLSLTTSYHLFGTVLNLKQLDLTFIRHNAKEKSRRDLLGGGGKYSRDIDGSSRGWVSNKIIFSLFMFLMV